MPDTPGFDATSPTVPPDGAPGSLPELALLFLRLGVTAFGGPAAHIAMMEEAVVRRRAWLTHEQFLDNLGAANLLPGPSSTEVALYIGYRRAAWAGLFITGACFILPASVMVLAIAWCYVRFGHLPQLGGILYGVKPVIIAVIGVALWGLRRAALKAQSLTVVGTLAIVLSLIGANPLMILFGAGTLVSARRWLSQGCKRGARPLLFLFVAAGGLLLALKVMARHGAAPTPVGLLALFLVFLKAGSVVFGSGYVLLAFLRADLVGRLHWLSSAQLLDAVAVGQVTPGPVFTTATFIGYVLGGVQGAVAATVGTFLPAFFFVALSGPLVARVRTSPMAGAFLDGVNVAALGLMAAVTLQLGRAAVRDVTTGALALTSAVLLIRFRVNSAWLILAGATIGLLASSVGWRAY